MARTRLHRWRNSFVRVAAAFFLTTAPGTPTVWAADDSIVEFARDIQPIFAQKCLLCHGPDEQESGLRLDRRELATARAESGAAAIVSGNPDASELIKRVTSTNDDERMPPDGDPLTADEVDQLRDWIAVGASYDTHWAYRPLADEAPLEVKNTSWTRNEVDYFVLSQLESADIEPSPVADRYTLIKRLYYDLHGVPPTVAAVDSFVTDESPDAYERLVDRLLASPRFAERWARHWLDKARYADSDGYEKDNDRPDAWRYRDWVIEAIQRDLPFDEFTVEQLAGDMIPNRDGNQLLATAFNRQTLTNTEGGTDREQWRVAAVMDRTETIGSVWLGLTIGCARCHNHKYDQLTQREYYELFAYFDNGDETSADVPITTAQITRFERTKAEHDEKVAELGAQLERERSQALESELEKLIAAAPKPWMKARVVVEREQDRRRSHILRRGEFKQKLEAVRTGAPATLVASAKDPATRLDFARWLVDGETPLVPRVTVNHIWDHLFGFGLVRTLNDFGVRGERPSHPKLLDWLANEYIKHGWSRKQTIKKIVMSATYRQSSVNRPELAVVDPTNLLLHRQNRFRLEAEAIRDSCLSVAGLLADKVGGPSVFPPIPSGITDLNYNSSFKWNTSQGEDRYRRGMYTYFKRTAPHPNLTTLDCPDSNVTCVKRDRSNTPLAALITLNNAVFHETAQALARRALRWQADSDGARLGDLIRTCVARPAREHELITLQQLLHTSRDWYADHADAADKLVGPYSTENENVSNAEMAAWVATVRIVLNLDEFITRE